MSPDKDRIVRKAYAKVNLGLEVLGKRPDGFHEVAMVMQSVSLHDTLTLTLRDKDISLACDRPDLPCDASNLAYRAAELLKQECAVAQGVHIDLVKRIPLAAGLAGGSSDAAAVLRGLNALWGLALPECDLETLAALLGSDVPFCLQGGTTLATGRGEILKPLPDFPGVGVVLANPPLQVSTAWVYGNFKRVERLRRGNLPALAQAVENRDLAAMAGQLFNDLEAVTVAEYPQISTMKDKLSDGGAVGVLMSGSGPTVFGLTPDLISARRLAGQVALDAGVAIFAAETVAREEN